VGNLVASVIVVSITVLIVGSLYRLWRVLQTPQPNRIPITPAPATRLGIIGQLLFETITFRSLLRSSVWTWVLGWSFHVSLLLTIAIHFRFFSISALPVVGTLMPYTSSISFVLVASLLGLLARRVFVDRVRYISSLSDYVHLGLLLFIAGCGMMLASSNKVNVYEVTVFVQALLKGEFEVLSMNYVFLAHTIGAGVLFCVYPFSKLFHGPLLWVNPTRSTPDKSRR